MRNIIELPKDLLVKILSLLPAKDILATSVLSKQWKCLWKQVDVDYIELCSDCSDVIVRYLYGGLGSRLKLKFVSLISEIKAEACIECKGRIQAEKKVTIFIPELFCFQRKWAFIWTKLEDKQQMQIESVFGGTQLFCRFIKLVEETHECLHRDIGTQE